MVFTSRNVYNHTPVEVGLSKKFKLKQFFPKRQVQAHFDIKEKGMYKPLANRRETNKPLDWSTLQKEWLSINWDNNLNTLKLDSLPDEDKKDASNLMEEIKTYWNVFQNNVIALKGNNLTGMDYPK